MEAVQIAKLLEYVGETNHSRPVLHGVVKQSYVKHPSLLVSAVFMLLKENISFQDINNVKIKKNKNRTIRT